MEYINKAMRIHGDKYDYSKVNYKNSYTKVVIICKEHGEFEQTFNSHLSGHGCPKCSKFTRDKKVKTQNFINKAMRVHGDRYDYSKVVHKNNKTKVKIICQEHGEFEQQPNHHVSGHGCPVCAVNNRNCSHKLNNESFTNKAMRVHGDRYDYSKAVYKNNKTKVKIICQEHGEFEQIPVVHLRGGNCPKCARDKTIKAHLSNTHEFIEKANKIHNNKYDYSKVNYSHNKEKVTIICQEHGEFEQAPMDHLKGHGCLECVDNSWNIGLFLQKSKEIHNDRYDYSKVNYVNCNTKVTIICQEHGEFEQTPYNHVFGSGCIKCGLSTYQHQLINYVSNICKEKILINDRKVIRPYELDIYVPNHNLAIEFNGLFWHSYDRPESVDEKNKHKNKSEVCNTKNINLFHIYEHDWLHKKDLIKSMISGKLNKNNKIFARKCKLVKLENDQYRNFMNDNHLQGYVPSFIKMGLEYNDDLVCVIGVNKSKKYEWEISRFASKKFYNVIGGFSKLLSHFVNDYNPSTIMSYANMDHSCGNLYIKNGFTLVDTIKPGYFYVKGTKVFSRQKFQKHKLAKKLQYFDPQLTESQNMFNNGYRRLWNAGNLKFIKYFYLQLI